MLIFFDEPESEAPVALAVEKRCVLAGIVITVLHSAHRF
jgi:hypothetical protein